MTREQDDALERAAAELADTGEAPAPGAALDDGERAALAAIARVARAHRQARPRGSTPASLADLAEQTPPAFEWGLLRALEKVGEGSFGEVWRAYDPSLHREVALKLRRLETVAGAPPLAATHDPATRQWLDEARALARVRHPNVLTVHGAAEHHGRVGMWTELLRGETLEDRIARGRVAPREAASLVADLCAGLAAVHRAGLVHGDIKAANVKIEPPHGPHERARIVLMDFGAARLRSQGGFVSGTPLAMAPEVLEGAPPTATSDLYAIGALLFRLLAGEHPTNASDFDGLRRAHAARGPAPPRLPASAGPRALARLVEHALDPDPARRPASAETMRRELLAIATPSRVLVPRITAGLGVLLAAAAIVWWLDWRPSSNRFFPPERLPGPWIHPGFAIADTLVGEPGDQLGWESVSVGDLNGDGCDDVVVGRVHATRTVFEQGSVELRLGSRSGRFSPPVWTLHGRERGALLPRSIASFPDLNGDGRRELLIAEYDFDTPARRARGMVGLHLSRGIGFDPLPSTRLVGALDDRRFGDAGSIADVGDVNGDGWHDLLVASLESDGEHPGSGRVDLFLGRAGGLDTVPSWSVSGRDPYSLIGWQVAEAGDVNGDGYADVVLGVPGGLTHGMRTGRVELYPGGPSGPTARPSQVIAGRQLDGDFGYKVVGLGDLDHDGYGDLMVGERYWDGRELGAGRVLLYRGGRAGIVDPPVWTGLRCGSGALLGSRVERIGDMDGDGASEVALGSEAYSASRSRAGIGLVTVIRFARADVTRPEFVHLTPASRRDRAAESNTAFGAGVETAGDFNGDGLADLVIGAPRYRGDRGAVFLVLGRRPDPGLVQASGSPHEHGLLSRDTSPVQAHPPHVESRRGQGTVIRAAIPHDMVGSGFVKPSFEPANTTPLQVVDHQVDIGTRRKLKLDGEIPRERVLQVFRVEHQW